MARVKLIASPISIRSGIPWRRPAAARPSRTWRAGGRHARAVAPFIIILLGLSLLSACGSNRNAFTEPTPRSDGSSQPPTDGGILPTDGGTSPAAYREIPPGEPTLGERLGRLDAMMRTAPADSLPLLQAEYDRLLEEETGTGDIQTGGVRRPADGETSVAGDTITGTTTTGTTITGGDELFATPSYPREGRGGDILDMPYDSTVQLKGLRASELRYADGNINATEAIPESQEARPRESKPRARSGTGKNETSRMAASSRASDTRASSRGSSRTSAKASSSSKGRSQQGGKSFVDGVAASRAGWHAEATDELPKALATPLPSKRRTVAHYSYGESLEQTGKLSQAADNYLKASKESSGLGHKSYISYCRVLAKSGQKERAKQLLVQFIGKHPKSDQVVNARQLLQTL